MTQASSDLNLPDMNAFSKIVMLVAIFANAAEVKGFATMSNMEPTDADADADADTDTDTDADTDVCAGEATGTLPTDAVWLQYDGTSSSTFSLADAVLSDRWGGSYGTYNLNEVGVAGAQGFLFERPGRVVGVQVQWDNLPESVEPVYLQVWPDFGSDG